MQVPGNLPAVRPQSQASSRQVRRLFAIQIFHAFQSGIRNTNCYDGHEMMFDCVCMCMCVWIVCEDLKLHSRGVRYCGTALNEATTIMGISKLITSTTYPADFTTCRELYMVMKQMLRLSLGSVLEKLVFPHLTYGITPS